MPQTEMTQSEFRSVVEQYVKRRNGLTGTVPGMLPFTLIRTDAEKATLTLRAEPEPWTRNQNGVVHGGIVATMFDSAMGTLCRCYSGDPSTPTISMTINYCNPVPIATPLLFSVELHHLGSNTIHLQAQCATENDPGRILATAQAVYYRV